MNYGSVCTGIAADTVAWHQLGWTAAFFAETAAFPSRVLDVRWPNVPNLGDFTRIHAPPPIDVLVGGTPCQPFSVAGLRAGLGDDRGNLALEFLRLADRARPLWLVWENVPGVFSSVSHLAPDALPPPHDLASRDRWHDGDEVVVEDEYDSGEKHALACFLGGLSELGYGWAYRVLDAQYAGVPQRRRRIFVVGCARGWAGAAAVLFERESLRWNSPPSRAARADVASTLGAGAPGSGWRDDLERAGAFIPVARTITSRDGRHHDESLLGGEVVGTLMAAQDRGNRGHGVLSPFAFDLTQITHPDNRAQPAPGKPAPALNKTSQTAVAFDIRQDPCSSDDVSPALTVSERSKGVMSAAAVRRLLPVEAERLQGFPDGYTAIKGASDSARYEALGNSMAVPVMRWIGQRIELVTSILRGKQ